jgi:plastocyanin
LGEGRNQMRRWIWSIVAVIAVVIPTAAAIWADARPSQAAGNRVDIEDHESYAGQWKFVPDNLTVTRGSTVVWLNTSGRYYHTVMANDGSFDSKYINPGAEWQRTFSAAGDFPYHCEPHPWMKGVIHVK